MPVDITLAPGLPVRSDADTGYNPVRAEASPIFWYETDSGITLNSGNVSAWASTVNGLTLTQGTAGSQPLFIASDPTFLGRPSISPDGSVDYLESPSNFGPFAQPITWYAVCSWNTFANDFLFDRSAAGTLIERFLDNGLGIPNAAGGTNTLVGPATKGIPAAGVAFILCIVFNGASGAIYINDIVTANVSGDAGANGVESLRLFTRNDGSNQFDGKLAQIGAFRGAHDVTVRGRVFNYLREKYISPAPTDKYDVVTGQQKQLAADFDVRLSVAQVAKAENAVTPINPYGLAIKLYQSEPYIGAPWKGSKSADTSGDHAATQSTNSSPIALDTETKQPVLLGGRASPAFDGGSFFLTMDGTLADYATAAALSGWALVYVSSIASTNAGEQGYDNDTIFGTLSNAYLTIFVYKNAEGQPHVGMYTAAGAADRSIGVPISLNTWVLVQWKFGSSTMSLRTNMQPWKTRVASATIDSLANGVRMGVSWNGTYYFTGIIRELAHTTAALADVMFDGIVAWYQNEYGIDLGIPSTSLVVVMGSESPALRTPPSIDARAEALSSLFLSTQTQFGALTQGSPFDSEGTAIATANTRELREKNPRDIGSPTALRGWYRADKGVTLLGGKVTRWRDQSDYGTDTAGRDLLQAEPTLAPTLDVVDDAFNGRPTLFLGGANSPAWLKTAAAFNEGNIASPLTFYFAMRWRAIVGGFILDHWTGARFAFADSSARPYVTNGTAAVSGNVPSKEPVMVCIVAKTGVTKVYINDSITPVSLGDAGVDGFGSLMIGQIVTLGSFFDGRLAEFAFYAEQHAETARRAMFRYMADRYGIQHRVYNTNPAGYSLSGWWHAAGFLSNNTTDWKADESAGASYANGSLTEATNPPIRATSPLGNTFPAEFDGTNDQLVGSTATTTFFTATGSAVWALFYIISAATDSGAGTRYNNPGVIAHNGGGTIFNISVSTAGVAVNMYDAAWKEINFACAVGSWHLMQVTHDGTDLKARLDLAGSFTTTPCGTVGWDAASLVMGRNYSATFANIRVAEVGCSAGAFGTGDFDEIVKYVHTHYDILLLKAVGWWRDYAAVTWVGSPSAGPSDALSLAAGVLPTSGAAVKNHTPAVFNGLGHVLNATLTLLGTAGGAFVVFKTPKGTRVPAATGGAGYDDPALLSENGSAWAMTLTQSGVGFHSYDGTHRDVYAACPDDDEWHIAMLRWDGAVVGVTVDAGTEVTQAVGTITSLGATFKMGGNWNATALLRGSILDAMVLKVTPSTDDFALYKAYANARYGLSR